MYHERGMRLALLMMRSMYTWKRCLKLFLVVTNPAVVLSFILLPTDITSRGELVTFPLVHTTIHQR